MYLLGDLEAYSSQDDIRSDDIQALYEQAKQMSEEAPENSFGIWANEGDDLIAIAHNGEIFLKAKL
jgi:hypothetical protein